MTTFRVNYKSTNPRCIILTAGGPAAIPREGFVNMGLITHTPDNNADGYDANVALFHLVRDAAYPHKVWDFQSVPIIQADPLRILDFAPAVASTLEVGAKSNLTFVATPTGAIDADDVTFVSTDTSKLTIAKEGGVWKMTGVAAGTVDIEVHGSDELTGEHMKPKTITVTAAAG